MLLLDTVATGYVLLLLLLDTVATGYVLLLVTGVATGCVTTGCLVVVL